MKAHTVLEPKIYAAMVAQQASTREKRRVNANRAASWEQLTALRTRNFDLVARSTLVYLVASRGQLVLPPQFCWITPFGVSTNRIG